MSVSYSPLSGYMRISIPTPKLPGGQTIHIINANRVLDMKLKFGTDTYYLTCMYGHVVCGQGQYSSIVQTNEHYLLGTPEHALPIWSQITNLLMEGSMTLEPTAYAGAGDASPLKR